jgi:N-acetylmuramoyl-L-alanine amidase
MEVFSMLPARAAVLWKFLLFLLIFALLAGLFSGAAGTLGNATLPTQSDTGTATSGTFTVVLDAGHGGEDGGAVSATDIYEKDLNLAIAKILREMLEANGIPVVMTRETDVLLYDRHSDYRGHKKAQDLATRLNISETTPDSVLVSIHMNAYPLSQYHGLQVWYSPNHPDSQKIAEQIQQTVESHLQPENERRVKAATGSIYLLHHSTRPAVLVECGFLSNPEEAERLNDPAYQRQLAFLIFLAILQGE